MKTRKLNLLAGLTFLFSCTCIVSSQDFNFRNTYWGMSQSEVKASENNVFISEDVNNIVYDYSLSNIKGNIIYYFTVDKKLVRAKYFLSPKYMNLKFYFRDYKMLQDLLKEKYGEPSSLSVNTMDREKITEDEWVLYLSTGSIRLETTWNLPATDIILTLSKVGDKPAVQIDYISKEYSKLDIKAKKDIIKKDL